jgi:hypothetical protein
LQNRFLNGDNEIFKRLHWPAFFIFLLWRKTNSPIIGIVCKVKPEIATLKVKLGAVGSKLLSDTIKI